LSTPTRKPGLGEPCAWCRRSHVWRRRWRGQLVLCSRCLNGPCRFCARCGQARRHTADDRGCLLCGATDPAPCTDCGSDSRTATGCLTCRLSRRLDRLAASGDPERARALAPLFEALRAADNPRSSLDWLSRSTPGKALFDVLLAGRVPLTHDTFDAASPRNHTTSVEYLRSTLVDTGILPERDEPMCRLERFIQRLLGEAHPTDAAAMHRYIAWRIMPRVRRRISEGRTPSTAITAAARVTIFAITRFTAWLREHRNGIEELTQTDLDLWVRANPTEGSRVRPFIRWARRQRLVPNMHYTLPERDRSPRLFDDQTQLLNAARRCLHDDELPARDRLASALILLYGQPLQRIATLRIADLDTSSTTVTLKLGPTPINLPAQLAVAAREAAALAIEQAPGITRATHEHPIWLFPGLPPTKHIHPSALRRRIRYLCPARIRGIQNTALLTLSREVPAIALADLLGMNVNTIHEWRALAGGAYAGYVASAGS